jgi:hypothetical protein
VVLVAVALVASSCGSSDDDAVHAGGSSAASSSPSSSAAATSEAEAGADGCGPAQTEIEAAVTWTGNVTSVDVPSCDEAFVTTTFGPGDVDPGVGLCPFAAQQASGHGVARVSILAADGTQLATGTTELDCVPAA